MKLPAFRSQWLTRSSYEIANYRSGFTINATCYANYRDMGEQTAHDLAQNVRGIIPQNEVEDDRS